MTNQDPEVDYWMVYANGSSAASVGGIGVIILKYGVQLQFPATNNGAEYEAVFTGLRVAKALGVRVEFRFKASNGADNQGV